MQSGDLCDRIGFYRPVVSDDGAGNQTSGFPDVPSLGPIAANITPKLGGESVLAGRLTGRNLVNITVRQSVQSRSVTTDWRARDERAGVVYNIRSIIDPNRGGPQHGQWLEMLCEEGVA